VNLRFDKGFRIIEYFKKDCAVVVKVAAGKWFPDFEIKDGCCCCQISNRFNTLRNTRLRVAFGVI